MIVSVFKAHILIVMAKQVVYFIWKILLGCVGGFGLCMIGFFHKLLESVDGIYFLLIKSDDNSAFAQAGHLGQAAWLNFCDHNTFFIV